jgi:hypothetical protein
MYNRRKFGGIVRLRFAPDRDPKLMLSRIVSMALFIATNKTEKPFRAHLLGVIKEQALLPLMLPYKASKQHPMFSEMSFKCRSSTSLSSRTLVPSCDSTMTLLPSKADKVVGLGI